jgi:hypothetical protein
VEETFSVRVRARYRLRFHLGTDAITSAPEQPVELRYYLRNRGNTRDTVDVEVRAPTGWAQRVVPARVVLEPGDTAVGTVQVAPPLGARAGEEKVLEVAARSGGGRASRSARVVIVEDSNWFGDLASLPSTVFLGSTTESQGIGGVALNAAGEIRPGTRMTLQLRHTDQPLAAPALRRALTGPEFRLTASSPDWRLAAGDVYTGTGLFTGAPVHGTGIDAEWRGEDRGAALFAATPANGFGNERGHVIRAAGSLDTRLGRFTGIVSSLRRDADFVTGYNMQSGGVLFQTSVAAGDLSVQAGAMRVADDSAGSAVGPAVDAQFQMYGDRGTVIARLRSVPATVPRTSAYGDEASLSGTLRLVEGLSALGWGFLTRSPLLGVDGVDRGTGLAAGLRYDIGGSGTQIQLTGRTRQAVYPSTGFSTSRETLHGALDLPLGDLVAELDAEWGRSLVGDTGSWSPYNTARAGVRWSARGQWAAAGLNRRSYGAGSASVTADLAGSVRVGPAWIEGGLTTSLSTGLAESTAVWTGTTVDVTRQVSATLGVDYSPVGGGDRWRLSLGVARRFALPLPVRKEPAVHGVVYEDRNGNRVRDPDEPVLEAIPVRFGPLATETDTDGRFQFMEPVRGSLRIETAELPLGLIVPADVYLPGSGFVEIPVVRTAALDLTLFLDRDNDGEWDAVEDAADGVVVSLIGPQGRTRDVAADAQGRARISALSPGDYTLRIHPPATRRTGGPPIEREISIPPGGTVEETIAVPLRRREIRIPNSQRLQLQNTQGASEPGEGESAAGQSEAAASV